jgi:hypothetical protein
VRGRCRTAVASCALLVMLGASAAAVAGKPTAMTTSAVSRTHPGWKLYSGRGLSLELPPTWLSAAEFLSTPSFQRFARQHPQLGAAYRALVSHSRKRFAFIAVESSASVFRNASARSGRSYGLFPTIFLASAPAKGLLPEFHNYVVPSDWQGGGPGKQGCFKDRARTTETWCGYFYGTYSGTLLMIESRVPGRSSLVIGLAFAHTTHYLDAAKDEPTRTYKSVRLTVR